MSALRDALRDLPDAVFADMLESEDAYLVVVDLPGATADTVEARVDNGRLRIEAQREKELPAEFRYVSEERSLFLDATLLLPPDATGQGAEGSIERGVLELRLPKRETTADETIPIGEK
jgi:HSP20 family molecular chaperone IbpA